MSTGEELAERVRRLETENRRLVAMLDALDDHVILQDRDSNILFLNRATEEVSRVNYGVSSAEMIGRNVMEGPQSPEFKQYARGLVARASNGETVAEEFLLPMPDGAIWHEHHFHPVYGADGKIEAVATSSRNIQARKQAEGRLQLLSKIGLLAGTTDLDGLLARAASLAIPELADWSIFELVRAGQRQSVTVAHSDRERAGEAEKELADAQSQIKDVEMGSRIYRIGVDDEALRPEVRAALKRFDAATAIIVPFIVLGAPIAIATFVYGPESGRRHSPADLPIAEEVARRAGQIVENARLHAEVAHALEYRERVMGILGHDLRNPVSAVLSLSVTLSQRADVPDRAKEGLRHMHASAERMEEMISTLLDFTQLRFRGAPVLSRDNVDLEKLARTIVDELRAAHPTREITLVVGKELRGRWDVSRIGQVISNLVGNGLTHGARESPVSLSLKSDADYVYIAIANRGPTIPADALGKLFEPFWQAPKEGAAKSRGLGLGLFIVQQIVKAHGGAVVVESADAQTTFTVRLPR
jgi:PAS domain S-box-containing protein